MGTFEDIKAQLGEDFFTNKAPASDRTNWHELCACGHIDRYHAQSVGGTYVVPETTTVTIRGEDWQRIVVFNGCRGALRPRSFEEETAVTDREESVITLTVNPTCPCTTFTPVVKVDRPNRYFNQRIPHTIEARDEFTRHPFLVGIRAFNTHLSRRKQALVNPDWAAAEFNRRFAWLDGKRVCEISGCHDVDDVWPVFVNPTDGDLRSQLRCPKHR